MKKTVAILGVDGTGKSSVINLLSQKLGSRCLVQYMGCRDFGSKTLDKIELKERHNALDKLLKILIIYKCFWNRYLKSTRSQKIVLFDRYVHEVFINSLHTTCHPAQILVNLLYRVLFPMPLVMVYLFCPVEISLSRKDDIVDVSRFKNMKDRFDQYFLHDKRILSINTAEHKPEEIADAILKILKKFEL